MHKIRVTIIHFLQNNRDYVFLTALASVLYPFLYYYNQNFLLLYSWEQFIFFIITYLAIPIAGFIIINYAIKRLSFLSFFRKYALTGLNFLNFIVLIIISTYGFQKKIIAIALIFAFGLMFLVYKQIKKIVLLQLLMSIIVIISLLPKLYSILNHSNEWLSLPDDIEHAVFLNKPNVYVIQPDGYVNFSELKKGYYNVKNNEIEYFLKDNDFDFYPDFRSNYYSTLTSNASMFAMKHHYYLKPKFKGDIYYDYGKTIAGKNSVLNVFNNNDYKTFLLLDYSYVLVNKPKIGFDFCNFSYSEISPMANSYSKKKDLLEDLKTSILKNKNTHNFYFIEKILPSHVQNYNRDSDGKTREGELYLDRLDEVNQWLEKMVNLIIELDKNSLIVIVSDHGGFVGYKSMEEAKTKTDEKSLIYSSFSAIMAIKWPDNIKTNFENKLKTNVNLFRILISCLSENEDYLNNLEADKSYMIIDKSAPGGVYELIDENYNTLFKKIN